MSTWWSQTCEHLQEPHGASCPLIIVTRTGPGLSFPDCVMIFASRFEKRMKELREANWWIRAPLRKDGDVSPDTDYVPDIFVHMPHLRFGKGSIYCPRCERADRVTPKQIPTHKCPIVVRSEDPHSRDRLIRCTRTRPACFASGTIIL